MALNTGNIYLNATKVFKKKEQKDAPERIAKKYLHEYEGFSTRGCRLTRDRFIWILCRC